MTAFTRNFPSSALWPAQPSGGRRWTENAGVIRLFEHWALPGTALNDPKALRIGIRGNTLNLYAKGQSVVQLSAGRDVPIAHVSSAYLDGHSKQPGRGPSKTVRVPDSEFTAAAVDRWITSAVTYAGAEKRFVDDLVAANPAVLDLETGLPGAGRAPRMDLAVVQRQPDGAAALAFWEAKCSDNAELRATLPAVYREDGNGDQTGGIPVIGQLRKYQRWMTDERRDEVRAAFAQTARILLALADHFARPGDEARAEWQRLLATPRPEIILPPGLVIGNYRPADHPPSRWEMVGNGRDRFAQRGATFAKFQNEISRHQIHIQQVAEGDSKRLDQLSSAL